MAAQTNAFQSSISDITLILHCSQQFLDTLILKLIENNGPEGLRSLGSPVMSRLLYQAELRAPVNSDLMQYLQFRKTCNHWIKVFADKN